MRFILTVFPQAAFATDNHGWLPLHCLVDNDPSEMTASRIESLRLLLAANPKGVLTKNISGRTPLDTVRVRGHRDFILRVMLLACPEADPATLGRLNWNSQRKTALLTLLALDTQLRLNYNGRTLVDSQHENVVVPVFGTSAYCVRIYQTLLAGAVTESGDCIESSILRHVIKFL
jgi:hypothetical protein